MNFISIVVLSLVHVCWVMNDEQCVLCTVLNLQTLLSVCQEYLKTRFFKATFLLVLLCKVIPSLPQLFIICENQLPILFLFFS